MNDALTEDQVRLVATALAYGPFPPKPEYLPDCHRLAERGWFDYILTEKSIVCQLSERGMKALEIDASLDAAMN
jgi:hypothetical protein